MGMREHLVRRFSRREDASLNAVDVPWTCRGVAPQL